MKHLSSLLTVGVVLAGAAPASAFSDHTLFAAGVDKGGGGGRFFTGSRADGYSCSVCHKDGPEATFTIEGLPDTLVSGTKYDLVIRWDHPEVPHALQLELATPSGAHPSVTVIPAAMLPPASRCGGTAAGEPAVYTIDVGVRRIVGVDDCNASSVNVSFVANGQPIELSIGGVVSDASGTADGDGIFERRIALGQRAASPGCAAGGPTGPVGLGLVTAALVLVPMIPTGRRRRSRRASRTSG